MDISWRKYIDKTKDLPPREILVERASLTSGKYKALDLGAGSLIDSRYLLEQGFGHVTAVDTSIDSWCMAKEMLFGSYTFVLRRIEDFSFPPDAYDLVNAQRALPFVRQSSFDSVFQSVLRSLKGGGIFTATLFGERNQNLIPGFSPSCITKDHLLNFLSGVKLLKFEEEEECKESALGKINHFHEFRIIVRK